MLADRTGSRRGVGPLAATNLAGFVSFASAHGLWPLLLINALTTAAAFR
jgi:hypothetical protein